MRLRLLLATALLAAPVATCCVVPCAAHATEPVDVALVLVSDVSRSIDDTEYDLEKKGYAAAFTDSAVLTAIRGGVAGAIAVNYVEFASESEVRTVIDWTVVHDEASAREFAAKLGAAPRSFYGRTAISAGIDRAVQSLASIQFETQRKVIDVCGDGTNNAGREVSTARDDAVAAGITINGLAIINEHPVSWTYAHVQPPGGLDNYYRQNVTGGTGSFVLQVRSFDAFADAIKRKLINEIAALDQNTPHRL